MLDITGCIPVDYFTLKVVGFSSACLIEGRDLIKRLMSISHSDIILDQFVRREI